MFLVDIVILLFLGFGFVIGFRRGFTRELVSFVGLVVITILSFILKNPISVLMYKNLPFFKFNYLIKGATVINILFYEIIAFLIVFSILLIILKILIKITKIFEKILKMTIVLGIPSKILGGIVGIIKNYILTFIVLYVLALPIFSLDIKNTIIGDKILSNSPGLSDVTNNTVQVFDEFSTLVDKYKQENNTEKFNQESLDLLIKYNIISKDNAIDLIDSGKIKDVSIK